MSSPIPILSLNHLSANLQEIYSTLDANLQETCALVGNRSGSRVYAAQSFWGRYWSMIYYIPNTLGADGPASDNFANAIRTTANAFQVQFKLIEVTADTYRQYLTERCEGYSPEERELHSVRSHLTAWNHGITPFLNLLQINRGGRILALFRNIFQGSADLSTEAKFYSFFEQDLFKRICGYQELLDLEGQTGGPLPLVPLFKVATRRELSKSEEIELSNFVEKINEAEGTSIEKLLKALQVLVDHFVSKHYKVDLMNKPHRGLLEIYLNQIGCQLFKKVDSQHLAWRESLKSGDQLQLLDRKVTLGARLGKKKESDDNLLFQVEGERELIVRVGKNRSVLHLEEYSSKEKMEVIHKAAVILIDVEGRCSLMERLYPLIEKRQSSDFSNAHTIVLDGIVKLIDQFVTGGFCFKEITLNYLMQSTSGEIKSTRNMTRIPFDFDLIENFIFDLSPGRPEIYSYVMGKSKLNSHPIANYYRATFRHVVKESAEVLITEGLPEKVIARAAVLSSEARSVRGSCIQQLTHMKGVEELPDETEQRLQQALLACYHDYHLAARLWPTLKEDVIRRMGA